MSNASCIYFDGAIVQVVKACITGDSTTINDAHTFPHDDLDDYLSGCREKNYILCYNPLQFHQDIVHLPPAAGRQYDKLVRSEVRKIHADLTSFTTFHTTVGQATIDTRVYNKIAAFSYVEDPLSDILSVFSRHGKSISHIYAAPHSIFRLLASACRNDSAQARIFIAALPGEKLLLVGENNELEFIRKLPSTGADLRPTDTHNINMTLDYCFQTLRVRPAEAVMLKRTEDPTDERPPHLSVPLTSVFPHALAGVPEDILADYLAPLAAVLHSHTDPCLGDILPADYISFSRNRKTLTAASTLMVALALILAGYAMTQWMVVSDLKSGIATLRSQLGNAGEEIAAFRKLDEEVNVLNKPLEILNKQRTSLHPAVALASLALPKSREYSIKSISIQDGDGFLALQIEGDIDSDGFSNIQATFESIIEQIGKLPGHSVSSSTLDIKQKTFKIQSRYNGIAQKGK